MADTVFADGMYIDWLGKKHKDRPENAPEFVLGKFSFKADAFIQTLQNNVNEKGYVTVDFKRAKSGKAYLAVDTWRPEPQQQAPPQQQQAPQQQASQFTQNNNLAPPLQDTTDYGPKDEFGF